RAHVLVHNPQQPLSFLPRGWTSPEVIVLVQPHHLDVGDRSLLTLIPERHAHALATRHHRTRTRARKPPAKAPPTSQVGGTLLPFKSRGKPKLLKRDLIAVIVFFFRGFTGLRARRHRLLRRGRPCRATLRSRRGGIRWRNDRGDTPCHQHQTDQRAATATPRQRDLRPR